MTVRPSSLLPPENLEAARETASERCGHTLNKYELFSYLMYPKVFLEYSAAARKYGPVSKLPTPIFFYGMTVGQELSVEIEKGKTLLIALRAIGEVNNDGKVEVFF